jgi:hypothetical protein
MAKYDTITHGIAKDDIHHSKMLLRATPFVSDNDVRTSNRKDTRQSCGVVVFKPYVLRCGSTTTLRLLSLYIIWDISLIARVSMWLGKCKRATVRAL